MSSRIAVVLAMLVLGTPPSSAARAEIIEEQIRILEKK